MSNIINHCKPSILGYHYFGKQPYRTNRYWEIYLTSTDHVFIPKKSRLWMPNPILVRKSAKAAWYVRDYTYPCCIEIITKAFFWRISMKEPLLKGRVIRIFFWILGVQVLIADKWCRRHTWADWWNGCPRIGVSPFQSCTCNWPVYRRTTLVALHCRTQVG